MRGPKLNEGATAAQTMAGERHGTKATARYVRSSAYKARVVLDLIRGLDVRRADEVLQFTERSIARDIRKVLASAVANASNPDNEGSYLADADELFVLACFADEGPTLRRFRPRARGRATRIRKRTCHITIVVARMSDERLEIVQARAEGANASAAASRRARVERSRRRTQATDDTGEVTEADVAEADVAEAEETEETDAAETESETEVQDVADVDTTDEGSASDESDGGSSGSEADAGPDQQDGEFADGEWAGSVLPDADGNGPESHPIKGNADSMLYHTPESRYYKVTKAEVWFDTEENAEAAGFAKPGTQKDED